MGRFFIFLTFIPAFAFANSELTGLWHSTTGTLCFSTGEVNPSWSRLNFAQDQNYRRSIHFSFPGHSCRNDLSGTYHAQAGKISFGQSRLSRECNGNPKPDSEIPQHEVTYEISGDELKIMYQDNYCTNLITTYRKVQ